MPRKYLLWGLAFALMAAVMAMAAKEAPRSAHHPHHPTATDTRDSFEGFEGAWLPEGWQFYSASGHMDQENWYHGTEAYEGSFCAAIDFDPDLLPQDCLLTFEHMVKEGEDHLNFWIAGSDYHSANYDCTVEINEHTVYSWADNAVGSYVYSLVDLDLSEHLGQSVDIGFRYQGVDGAALYLDAVGLNEGVEPPPPPEPPANDTCEDIYYSWDHELAPGAFSIWTDNTLANPDYSLTYPSCTGYSCSGRDVVYSVCLQAGEQLDVAMQCSFDAALYIITDCDDPQNSCVAGADATVSEGYEEIMGFVAPANAIYYIIVSAYSDGSGPIELFGVNYGSGCIIATEEQTLDGMKAMYR